MLKHFQLLLCSFVVLAFFTTVLFLFTISITAFFIVTGCSDKFTLQVVDISLVIKEVLLLVALDLHASQAFLGQVFWVVDIDNILVILLLNTTLIVLLLLLQRHELRLSQVINIQLALALITHILLILTLCLLSFFLVILELLLHHLLLHHLIFIVLRFCQLIYLILHETRPIVTLRRV